MKFVGAVRNIQTNELRDTGIPQGTFSCPSGNSPYAPARRQRTFPRSAERNSLLGLNENRLARKGRIANATRVSRKTGKSKFSIED